jgi:TPR repeat protein
MFLPCRINVVHPMIRTLRTRRWKKVNDKETAQVEVSEQQKQEAKERLRSFQEEAEQGQAEAQYNLGLVYRDGDGVR